MNIIAAKHEPVNAVEAIQFAVTGCDLGKVLVARSKMGVCAILLGTNAEELEIELAKIFPDEVFIRNERVVKEDISKILRFLSSPNAGLDIVLDIRGTSFQRKVWEALRTIPAGRPLTFAQLACRISGPKSLRAIGQACAENPIALAIPCHRVMGNSGSLSNYRYDARCKRSLINREVVAA
jgi:AraC family transcriptional regulator of adaptative response/methylated-DNA-[protein]-cysteine methyltransferase